MKKILVVLLVLAVAGGVFAQASNWSMAAAVEIGTRIDFDPRIAGAPVSKLQEYESDVGTPKKPKTEQVALANGSLWNWWDWPRIKAVLNYAGPGYTVGLEMNTRHDNEFYISFARPNFKAKGAVWGFEDIFWKTQDGSGGVPSTWPFAGGAAENRTLKRLWGEYYLLDGMVTIEAAYLSEDLNSFWTSDKTATFYYHMTEVARNWLDEGRNWKGWYYKNHGFFDNVETFTRVDGHTYFRANLSFSGFDFGLMVPGLFGNGKNGTAGVNPRADDGGNRFVKDSMKQSIFGAKINMHPIEFAAQFKFQDYGVYFGGKFFLGPVSIGASFMGIMNPEQQSNADKRIKVGGEVSYDAGAMGAGVKAYLDRNNGPVQKDDPNYIDGYNQLVAFQPYFFFKVIPSHLGFKLDAGFYFTSNVVGKVTLSDMYWALQPAFFWNFNGTGAPLSYGWASGAGAATKMMARYRMISNTNSALDIIFSWHL